MQHAEQGPALRHRQDPQASHDWQYDVAMGLIAPHGGVIVEEFSDVGVSRSRPWKRRDKASELLVAVQNPHRGWADLVVGEPQRASWAVSTPRCSRS